MKRRVIMIGLATTLLLVGCASLGELLSIQRPTATVDSVRLTGLSFEGVELTADMTIDNPNPVGIDLTGVAYQLDIEGNRFLSGTQGEGVSIASFGESRISIPLSLRYNEIRQAVDAAGSRDELLYALSTTLSFQLPVIGEVALPLRAEGTVPMVRLPRIDVAALVVESIGITGARLRLSFDLENPNAFPLRVDALDYAFAVQNQPWVDGGLERALEIPRFGSELVSLVFELSFLSFGRSLRDLLMGDDAVQYAFDAALTVTPGLPLMEQVTLPYEMSGSVPLSR